MTTEQAAKQAAQERGYRYEAFGQYHFLRIRGTAEVLTFRSAEDVVKWLDSHFPSKM